MKIASAELQLSATHVSEQRHEIQENFRLWIGQRPNDAPQDAAPRTLGERVTLSDAGLAAAKLPEATAPDNSNAALDEDPKMLLIRLVLEALTGQRMRVFSPDEFSQRIGQTAGSSHRGQEGQTGQSAQQPAGFGIEYDRREVYSEVEQTSFAASGQVKTADGREISFSLQLNMSRSYREESTTSIRLGDAARKVDPLVINFGGKAADLVDQRFAFDLDADGKTEQIAQLAAGSGYLVFDRNGDGQINDGSEMFGPQSGDGFAELAKYDDDGNGWIDENDAIFSRLSLWNPGSKAEGTGIGLLAAGVGAISLSRVATPFDIKNDANGLLGQIRTSGIFLHEDGTAGTIQQIDLSA
ncbi:VCBS repeat-containing protein [Azonexus sp. R2A61]|uniref:VCBS repeat-containing protein n=1 Tax=Azonexus sp. R2A61 TaxID=2744443 RepID=UPI001F2C210C|nr:VCBS repeat-containing protein [Azonexus sp. R2A61]